MMEDPYCISFSYNSLTSTCQLSIYTTGGGGGVNDSTVVYQMNGESIIQMIVSVQYG